MNVLFIPDKFKGTLSAAAAAKAMATGWRKGRPGDTLRLLGMCDGGDGFGEVFGQLVGARRRWLRVMDAAHRPCRIPWWWQPRIETAVIESASIIGLAMLPANLFHPFQLDSFGLGNALKAVLSEGAKHCLIGLGGSATNDGGFGLARALGWQFLDQIGRPLSKWTELAMVAEIHAPARGRWFDELVIAVDVRNPLLGANGATRVYGPQKGLRPSDLAPAEKCLRRLAGVVRDAMGRDLGRAPGAGAAGGLGFGLLAFAGARLEPGFDVFSRYAALERHLRWADLVITGEGALDNSTRMGKGVGRVAECCYDLGLPCVALAGLVRFGGAELRQVFTQIYSLSDMAGLKKARLQPAFWLQRLTELIAQRWPQTVETISAHQG